MKEGKKKLFRKLAIIIILVGASLIAFISIFVKQARDQIARDAIMIESDKAFEEFTSFFVPSDKALSIIKNWGLTGILETGDHSRWIPHAGPGRHHRRRKRADRHRNAHPAGIEIRRFDGLDRGLVVGADHHRRRLAGS